LVPGFSFASSRLRRLTLFRAATKNTEREESSNQQEYGRWLGNRIVRFEARPREAFDVEYGSGIRKRCYRENPHGWGNNYPYPAKLSFCDGRSTQPPVMQRLGGFGPSIRQLAVFLQRL
jgi:hypothetical protein